MNILYIAFGAAPVNHLQCSFSVLSFLAQREADDRIWVLTDAPEWYAFFGESVGIIPVESELFKAWRGEADYIWRIKIRGIKYFYAAHPGQPVLYLDNDTFLYGQWPVLKAQLREGYSLMHRREGLLKDQRSKTERTMWRMLQGRAYGGTTIGPQHAMWNAGVLGLPVAAAAKVLTNTLDASDAMIADGVPMRLTEQFSFSVMLSEHASLLPAEAHIGHYWSNKEAWSAAIADFWSEAFLKKYTLPQTLSLFQQFDVHRLPAQIRVSNTRRRLLSLVDAVAPITMSAD